MSSPKKIKKRNKDTKIGSRLRQSPINYFSDLFIVAMVCLWIFDNIYQSIIASAVTISSIILSFKTGTISYDTSMWSAIGANVAIPLSCGGAIWMIKNSIQHAIANMKDRQAHEDFPSVDISNDELEDHEQPVKSTQCSNDGNESNDKS